MEALLVTLTILVFLVLIVLSYYVWKWEKLSTTAEKTEMVAPGTLGSPALPLASPVVSGDVELLHGKPGDWKHHSWRPSGHRDVEEALTTPGFAVRRGNVIEEGIQ